jgi:protein-S-isoprenylcysteine O-methyltransferase Ste14
VGPQAVLETMIDSNANRLTRNFIRVISRGPQLLAAFLSAGARLVMPLSHAPIAPATAIPEPSLTPSRRQKFATFLIRRRVRITAVALIILVAEDVFNGIRPRSIVDYHSFYSMLGVGLVFAGVALRSWAAGILHKNSQLTTRGPYGLVRHPLYIGSFLVMLGVSTLINDVENIWIVLGPILALLVFRAIHEERNLAQRFGAQWLQYTQSVPRFIPRGWPQDTFGSWSWNQWRLNREYRMAAAIGLGLIALQLWRVLE